jgi:hypothetical protein
MSGRRYRDPATPAPARSGTARPPRHAARDRWDGRESDPGTVPARPDVEPAAAHLPAQREAGTEPLPAQASAPAALDEAPRRRRPRRAEPTGPAVPTAVDDDGYRVLDPVLPAGADALGADAQATDAPATEGPAAPSTVLPPAPDVVPGGATAPSRSRRGRVLAAALAVVVLLAAGAGVLLSRRPGAVAPAAAAAATGRVLLVQVVGADGHGQLAALLGTSQGPAGTGGSVVLVPTRLLVDVTGAGTVPLSDAASRPDPAAAHALTDLLGLRIDGTWTLPVAGLAALVDQVGGVDVQVDHDVAVPSAGGAELTLPAGRQHLDGRTAAAYATVLDSAEPEQARLARFDDVLRAVLAALPADPGATAAVVRASGGSSTLGGPDLAAALVGLHAVVASGAATYDTLPVRGIDSGGDVALYGLDAGSARTELGQDFPGALQAAGPGTVRVLVENGVGTPGLLDAARSRLVARGLVFRDGGNAARFGLPASAVLVPDATARSTAEGRRVATALGLPASAVQVSGRGQTVADVVVLLGADFRP